MIIDEIEKRENYETRRRELSARFKAEDLAQEDADVAEVLGTAAGRRLFNGILARGNVFGTVFDEGMDSQRLAYETGRREFAVKIYQVANKLQPKLVFKAIEEWNERSASRREQLERIKD